MKLRSILFKCLLGAALFMTSLCANAQTTEERDSLLLEVENQEFDTAKVEMLARLSMQFAYFDVELADSLVKEMIRFSKEIGYDRGIGLGYHNQGIIHFIRDEDYELAAKYIKKGLAIAERIEDVSLTIQTMSNIANCYLMLEDFDQTLEWYFKALPLIENHLEGPSKTEAIQRNHLNFGLVYMRQEAYQLAVDNYKITAKMARESGNKMVEAKACNYLGLAYDYLLEMDSALFYYERSETISLELDYERNLTELYNNMGNTFRKLKQYDKALEYHHKSMRVDSALGSEGGHIASIVNMSHALVHLERYDEALARAKEAHALVGEDERFSYMLSEIYEAYGEALSKLGEYEEAYRYTRMSMEITDSVRTEENEHLLAEMEGKYEHAKQSNQINELKKNIAMEQARKLIEAEKEEGQWQVVYWASGLGLLALLAVVVGLIQKGKSNKRLLEQQQVIEAKNSDLESANFEIVQQRDEIDEINRDILASIRYAERIQNTILPDQEKIKRLLPDSFIFYLPKDIVAGDFYWIEEVGDTTLIASADCTGHGVPGALVSVVCSNALNAAVREFNLSDPAAILDKTAELVTAHFAGANSDVKDGMDIVLCAISNIPANGDEPAKTKLRYAGANSSLYIVKNAETLEEIKPDKQPIGEFADRQPFTPHEIVLEKGDQIYLFSDGYADQFGGPKGKKFKYRPFKDLLLQHQHLPMQAQLEIIKTSFIAWQGDLEQVDDVCLIGVRI